MNARSTLGTAEVLSRIAKLSVSTGFVHGANLLAIPILFLLYGAERYGDFAGFVAIVAPLAIIVSLRTDWLVARAEENEASSLVRFQCLALIWVALIATAALISLVVLSLAAVDRQILITVTAILATSLHETVFIYLMKFRSENAALALQWTKWGAVVGLQFLLINWIPSAGLEIGFALGQLIALIPFVPIRRIYGAKPIPVKLWLPSYGKRTLHYQYQSLIAQGSQYLPVYAFHLMGNKAASGAYFLVLRIVQAGTSVLGYNARRWVQANSARLDDRTRKHMFIASAVLLVVAPLLVLGGQLADLQNHSLFTVAGTAYVLDMAPMMVAWGFAVIAISPWLGLLNSEGGEPLVTRFESTNVLFRISIFLIMLGTTDPVLWVQFYFLPTVVLAGVLLVYVRRRWVGYAR